MSMRFEPSYFIYFQGGSGGNFIASLAIHALSRGQHAPVFHSSGHAHYLYTNHIKRFIPEWPPDADQLVTMVSACRDPWLVFCPPLNLRDQLTHECVTDYNLVITSTPEDQLELAFNHYYKNWRENDMKYTCPKLLDVYSQFREQGLMQEITRWSQLDTYQTMRLLKKYVADAGPLVQLDRPEDLVITYRDIHDRPDQILHTLSQWLGMELPHQIERVYEQYLMLNQSLRSKYWRP